MSIELRIAKINSPRGKSTVASVADPGGERAEAHLPQIQGEPNTDCKTIDCGATTFFVGTPIRAKNRTY